MKNSSFAVLEMLTGNFQKYSFQVAFFIKGVQYTYSHFHHRIAAIQKCVLSEIPEEEKYVGIISHDHIDTYSSIFALWFSGKAFVPLNPLNPAGRNTEIIRQMGLKYILSAGQSSGISTGDIQKIIDTISLKVDKPEIITCQVPPETDVYVLFTSGSTGIPKGVRINRLNLDSFYRSYLDFGPAYTFNDRFLQIYDISFDGSIPCYVVALCAGASVYTVPQDEIKYLYAYKLMKEQHLTVVKMTPSTLYFLKPYFDRISLPEVRICLFGGEALMLTSVEEWMKCVPNALIQNVYGPTEATIDSLIYNFNSGDFQYKSNRGVVSLGKSFGDFKYAVISATGKFAKEGEVGELCLHSRQVMRGYWNDNEKTERVFIELETSDGLMKFYRTGDLVFRDNDGFFMYQGRVDNQVQIQGYRVEPAEIEQQARVILGEVNLAAVRGSAKNGNTEIVLYIEGEELLREQVLLHLQLNLPHYMVPSKIIFLKELPRLVSGKTDRKLLSEKANYYEID